MALRGGGGACFLALDLGQEAHRKNSGWSPLFKRGISFKAWRASSSSLAHARAPPPLLAIKLCPRFVWASLWNQPSASLTPLKCANHQTSQRWASMSHPQGQGHLQEATWGPALAREGNGVGSHVQPTSAWPTGCQFSSAPPQGVEQAPQPQLDEPSTICS